MKKSLVAAGISLMLSTLPCAAGGTLGTDELVPLLKQTPEVYAALLESFDLRDSAFAEIRFGHTFPNLSGARLGPYEIEAKSKKSGKQIIIVLCTQPTYFNAAGKVLTDGKEHDAVKVRETLKAVLLRAPGTDRRYPCP